VPSKTHTTNNCAAFRPECNCRMRSLGDVLPGVLGGHSKPHPLRSQGEAEIVGFGEGGV
jgi:hypothetical protein